MACSGRVVWCGGARQQHWTPAAGLELSHLPVYSALSPTHLASFNQHLKGDAALVPDGFVYLQAQPDTCMQRLRRR